MRSQRKILFIVVCYKSEKWLSNLLQTIFPDKENSYQLILIDNAKMDDDYVSGILKSDSRISYINTGTNLNYGKANNIGLELAIESNFKYVGIINPDTWFPSNWLNSILNYIHENPMYGCISPLQLKYENDQLANWTQKQLKKGQSNPNIDEIIDRPFLEGSCMIFPTEVLKIVGGFDPIYEMYYEELDLCRRLSRFGFKLGIFCQSSYHHFSSENAPTPERTLKIDKSQFIYIMTNPNLSFFQNNLNAFFWLFRKGIYWIKGKKPEFLQLFLNILKYLPKNYRNLYLKWKKDSGIKINSLK